MLEHSWIGQILIGSFSMPYHTASSVLLLHLAMCYSYTNTYFGVCHLLSSGSLELDMANFAFS